MLKRVENRLYSVLLFICMQIVFVFVCLFVCLFVLSLKLGEFRKLKAHYGRFPDLMCDNYRPLQLLKGRKVYAVGNKN